MSVPDAMSARDAILGRIRSAVAALPREPHPGASPPLGAEPEQRSAFALFRERLVRSGGEALEADGWDRARELVSELAAGAEVVVGRAVPAGLVSETPDLGPERAELAVSMALAAAAETGSVLLDARDGRRVQLLAPSHVAIVRRKDLFRTLAEAMERAQADLPSAVGIHSGPSKSADIGQVVVKGVHGPGRLVCIAVGEAE